MMSKSLQSFILISQFFMILALEMTNPFLSLLIASQKGALASNIVFYSMLSLVLPMLANIVMTPIWGFAADRYGYKSMLMRAAWALVFTQGAMIWVNLARSGDLEQNSGKIRAIPGLLVHSPYSQNGLSTSP
ncbi:hypothetical protein [Legionella sp. km772]|uniref:hypothetical protein n=1 Tax=Legionella sp. km772 TaxID=2498111 RepID=UPI0026973433|nr:hypothetical protein [Legionella sp. km772]